MTILIAAIIMGAIFLVYMYWGYVNYKVFPMQKFINDENPVDHVPMIQCFHYLYSEGSNDKK